MANLNVIEKFMAVHQGTASKEEVIASQKGEYNEQFLKISSQEQLIKTANEVIMQNWPAFKNYKMAFTIDPSR